MAVKLSNPGTIYVKNIQKAMLNSSKCILSGKLIVYQKLEKRLQLISILIRLKYYTRIMHDVRICLNEFTSSMQTFVFMRDIRKFLMIYLL